MKVSRNGRTVTVSFDVAETPYASATERKAAEAQGREPVAKALFSSGGFVPDGHGAKISINVIKA